MKLLSNARNRIDKVMETTTPITAQYTRTDTHPETSKAAWYFALNHPVNNRHTANIAKYFRTVGQ